MVTTTAVTAIATPTTTSPNIATTIGRKAMVTMVTTTWWWWWLETGSCTYHRSCLAHDDRDLSRQWDRNPRATPGHGGNAGSSDGQAGGLSAVGHVLGLCALSTRVYKLGGLFLFGLVLGVEIGDVARVRWAVFKHLLLRLRLRLGGNHVIGGGRLLLLRQGTRRSILDKTIWVVQEVTQAYVDNAAICRHDREDATNGTEPVHVVHDFVRTVDGDMEDIIVEIGGHTDDIALLPPLAQEVCFEGLCDIVEVLFVQVAVHHPRARFTSYLLDLKLQEGDVENGGR